MSLSSEQAAKACGIVTALFWLPTLAIAVEKTSPNPLCNELLRGVDDRPVSLQEPLKQKKHVDAESDAKSRIQENLLQIAGLNAASSNVLLKLRPSSSTLLGTPTLVEIRNAGDIRIIFDVPGMGSQFTLIDQIELEASAAAHDRILTAEKIRLLEQGLKQKRNDIAVDLLELLPSGEVKLHIQKNHSDAESGRRQPSAPELPLNETLSSANLEKLERVLLAQRSGQPVRFTLTISPGPLIGRVFKVDQEKEQIEFIDQSGRRHALGLGKFSVHPAPKAFNDQTMARWRYINLNPQDRFVSEERLRQAYLRYENSFNPAALPYVTIRKAIKDPRTGQETIVDFELGIVDTHDFEIAKAVSSLLSRSLEDAKYTNGGYLPPKIVERVQTELVSPYGVANLWGRAGTRFVLSRPVGDGKREIVSSVLIGEERDTLFFFTSRFNNLKHRSLHVDLDFNLSVDGNAAHKWFDKFAFPETKRYKPAGFNHIANFVVEKEGVRGLGLARLMIQEIVKNYSRQYILKTGSPVKHSQRLLCGKGFWQIGDPPWLARMESLGFHPRLGAETFHIDVDWEPLVPTYDSAGKEIDHVSYNRSFGMPQMYENLLSGGQSTYRDLYNMIVETSQTGAPPPDGDHLIERIPLVVELAKSGRAKFQYFQLLFPFESLIINDARRAVGK